jgi:hypothetical protein
MLCIQRYSQNYRYYKEISIAQVKFKLFLILFFKCNKNNNLVDNKETHRHNQAILMRGKQLPVSAGGIMRPRYVLQLLICEKSQNC